ncbi:membrane dipeptidase [Sphingomonas sp.]|uniref:dipeptidase n=1 Tax=Sphingomonas sp. TaxID=28214 RepID=UPI0026298606|nr:membrane dipeptidase [Sphingomonas sp.]MDF2496332.1 peptidase renal dipeptidase [Sphingomonas sp.]
MIDRRTLLAGIVASGASSAAAQVVPAAEGPARDMLIVNALGGFSDPNGPRGKGAVPVEDRALLSERVIDDARASDMGAINITLGHVAGEGDPFAKTVRDIGIWDRRIRGRSDALAKIYTAADMARVRASGRIGVIYGFQNTTMLGSDAARVDTFADLGVRVIQLTYNPANAVGSGSMAPENGGITPFGREVIARLNANRVMVDLSHSGERTCLEAARLSAQPISINHTGCRALTDMPRNKTNEELRLVASKGGFVGIYFMPFLNPSSVASAADVVAHIEHAVKICGEDHVGIGTDGGTTGVDDMAAYRAAIRQEIAERKAAGISARGENPDTLPFVEDLSGPTQFQRLIALLEQRGHKAARIEKIMGGNFLRYARDVWGA